MAGPDADAAPRARSVEEQDLEDAYHEYLWGENSPRAFARRCKVGATRNQNSRNNVVSAEVGQDIVDLSREIPP